MRGEGFADPDLELAHAEMCERIVLLRRAGRRPSDIADECGVSVRQVYVVIKEYAATVRDRVGDLVAEMFAVHQDRLEALYEAAQSRLDALPPEASASDFCAAVRAAVMVLERQAKLLGLDRSANVGGPQNDWLSKASEGELRAAAEKWGLRLPERFRVPTA